MPACRRHGRECLLPAELTAPLQADRPDDNDRDAERQQLYSVRWLFEPKRVDHGADERHRHPHRECGAGRDGAHTHGQENHVARTEDGITQERQQRLSMQRVAEQPGQPISFTAFTSMAFTA